MNKPTYYLWKNDFLTPEAYRSAKDRLTELGFRVVTFTDGPADKNIHEGLKAVIRNHYRME